MKRGVLLYFFMVLWISLCGYNHTIVAQERAMSLKDAFKESGKGIGQSFVKVPALRIDYILHNERFKSYNYTQYKQQLSDHYAVSCEFKISP